MAVRAGLKSALETLRAGEGEDPVAAAFKIAKFLEGMSARKLEALQQAIDKLTPEDFDRVRDTLVAAANIHIRLAEFAFPKLSRVDYVGDVPSGQQQQGETRIENKYLFVLNIGDERPGRPVTIEHESQLGGNDAADDDGHGNGADPAS